jgi:hypothetical protein
MRMILLVQIFLLVFPSVYGQDRSDSIRNLTIKFPVTSLFGDLYGESMGIGIGIEKMIKPRFSFSQEVNYIFHVDRTSILSEDMESINGLKFTTEIRKYLIRKEVPESGFFVNMELKNIITNSVKKSGITAGGTEENEITRYRGVLTANFGVLFYWDPHKKSRITLELLGGGGLGYIKAKSGINREIPGAKSDYSSANGFYPWINFDMKIGYILKHRKP